MNRFSWQMRSLWACVVSLVVTGAAGCSKASGAEGQAAAAASAGPSAARSAAAAPASAGPPKTPMLRGERARALAVPGHGDAVVVVPLGATRRRPVLVATHGNYDRPEWQCGVWGEIVQGRAFVLCPRGVKRSDSPGRDDARYEYASLPALESEIEAGLGALKAAFPEHVDDGPMVLTGFSLGAIMAVFVASKRPSRFDRLVLIEGGDGWQPKTAQAFRQGGGQRVLFACSLPTCEAADKNAAALLRKAGVEVELVRGTNMSHSYGGDVMAKYASRFAWLIEGDPRW